jgi:hypothetical protein
MPLPEAKLPTFEEAIEMIEEAGRRLEEVWRERSLTPRPEPEFNPYECMTPWFFKAVHQELIETLSAVLAARLAAQLKNGDS